MVQQACKVDNETSVETKERVKGYAKKFDAQRLKQKSFLSSKKKSRRGDFDR